MRQKLSSRQQTRLTTEVPHIMGDDKSFFFCNADEYYYQSLSIEEEPLHSENTILRAF